MEYKSANSYEDSPLEAIYDEKLAVYEKLKRSGVTVGELRDAFLGKQKAWREWEETKNPLADFRSEGKGE